MEQLKRWRSKGVAVLLLSMSWWGGIGIEPLSAASSCACFCGDPTNGAEEEGSQDSANDCAQVCAEAEKTFVGCFTEEDLYPENNNLCWTKNECETYPIEIGTTTYKGTWGEQNAYCAKKAVTGEDMGYCYGPLIPVVLNVPILGVTEVGTIGDYVNIVYKYLIPAAALFAALMFTLAGFQYMTAGGDKGAVAKAKTRMTNTVMGIVLLMSVYAIAYLIDPRLTYLNALRPPLVKKAVIVDDKTTCESLMGYGFDVSPTSGTCGEKGEITGEDNVDINIANPPEVGDACTFSGCNDKGKACMIKGDNSGGVCIACAEVSDLNSSLGVLPSNDVCSSIASSADAKDTNDDHKYACYFDDDFSDFSASDVGADECVTLFTDASSYIDCNALKARVEDEEDACDAYEYVNADSYGADAENLTSDIFNTGSADQIEDFKEVFEALCEKDVCKLSTEASGSCTFVDANVVQDILDNSTILDVFDNYACAGAKILNPPN